MLSKTRTNRRGLLTRTSAQRHNDFGFIKVAPRPIEPRPRWVGAAASWAIIIEGLLTDRTYKRVYTGTKSHGGRRRHTNTVYPSAAGSQWAERKNTIITRRHAKPFRRRVVQGKGGGGRVVCKDASLTGTQTFSLL